MMLAIYDPRLLSIRMDINAVISELQDMAVAHPDARDTLNGIALDLTALRDRLIPVFPRRIPTDPMEREEYLDAFVRKQGAIA